MNTPTLLLLPTLSPFEFVFVLAPSKTPLLYAPDDDGHNTSHEGQEADPEDPAHDSAALAFALLSCEP